MPKYYCEYCDINLTHSSPAGRRQHNSGRRHITNKVEFYNNLINDPSFVPPPHVDVGARMRHFVSPGFFGAPRMPMIMRPHGMGSGGPQGFLPPHQIPPSTRGGMSLGHGHSMFPLISNTGGGPGAAMPPMRKFDGTAGAIGGSFRPNMLGNAQLHNRSTVGGLSFNGKSSMNRSTGGSGGGMTSNTGHQSAGPAAAVSGTG